MKRQDILLHCHIEARVLRVERGGRVLNAGENLNHTRLFAGDSEAHPLQHAADKLRFERVRHGVLVHRH